MLEELSRRGVRLTTDAEEFLKSTPSDSLLQKIILLEKPLISKSDIEGLIEPKTTDSVVVNRPADFRPIAKEYDAQIKVDHKRDVTGKSRTKGEVDNFIACFRNRFQRLMCLLKRNGTAGYVELAGIKKQINEKARIIVLVTDKRKTKKGNILLDVEDLTGSFKVVISNSKFNEKIAEIAKNILRDDVIAITGKVMEPYLIAEEIEWPDLPVIREKKRSEVDVATAYMSDIHFGSKYFLGKYLKAFTDWLCGKGTSKELAGKVKYIVIAGDIVDGIGIYPNQHRELTIKDIYEQYKMFDDFVESLPDHIKVIVAPGNHDAVRRGEPQPALGKDLVSSDIVAVGNPSYVTIEGMKHIIYHGTSIDSMIASLPQASYMHPEKVMVEYLKRRHLSPIYGGNLIIPENIDYMVIEDPPDVLHCGHVHKNGYTKYRGTLVINSGTFQDRTDFQVKQGHMPTPALVPVYEMKYGRLRTLDFKS